MQCIWTCACSRQKKTQTIHYPILPTHNLWLFVHVFQFCTITGYISYSCPQIIRSCLLQRKCGLIRGQASLEGDNLIVFYYLSAFGFIRNVAFGGRGLMRGHLLYIDIQNSQSDITKVQKKLLNYKVPLLLVKYISCIIPHSFGYKIEYKYNNHNTIISVESIKVRMRPLCTNSSTNTFCSHTIASKLGLF